MSSSSRDPRPHSEDSLPVVLLADDVAENRLLLRYVLERGGFRVIETSNGHEAVQLVRSERPNLVLLDVVMPELDGLQVLERLHKEDPHLPVVIMTASEDPTVADRALELGAINFLRTPCDPREVEFVAKRVQSALEEEAEIRSAQGLVHLRETRAQISNDFEQVGPLVALLGRELRHHYPGGLLPITEIKLALYEALANAIEHGNLEIGFDDKSRALEHRGGMRALVDERRAEAPYRGRKVHVHVTYGPRRIVYAIRDEGPGFRPDEMETSRIAADPTTALHGRGLLLIRHYVDGVEWSPGGDEIRLTVKVPGKATEPVRSGA